MAREKLKNIWQRFKLTDKRVYFFYCGLALFVLGPLLLSGYILTLDMSWTPELPVPSDVTSSSPFHWLLYLLDYILPSQLIQKILLFLILVLAGGGMHRLIEGSKEKAEKLRLGAYFAGILYVINPFTYERWMAGHYLLLAGCALLPWLVRALFNFLSKPSRKQALYVLLWFVAISILSLHMLILSLAAAIVIIVVHLAAHRGNRVHIKKTLRFSGLIALALVAASSYWLLAIATGNSSLTELVSRFDDRHLEAFTTAAHPMLGLLANVAGMYGFWLERFHRFAMPNANMVLWLSALSVLGILIAVGIYRLWRNSRAQCLSILILGIIGFFVASGIHAPLWGGVNRWLITNVPGLQGFREPQKFSALLVLMYCFFAGHGLPWLIEKSRRKARQWANALYIVLLLPIALVPIMPLGFAGQLKPVDYPQSWYTFDEQLKQESDNYQILFLPWHQYMSFDFSPRIINNPAPSFFAKPVIAGDNAEFGEVFRDTDNPTSDYIEQKILGEAYATDLGSRLIKLKVKYVLLAHGPDWEQYDFLNHQPQLEKIVEDTSLIVYRNKEYIE